jgi:hypothetical protein
MILKDFGKIPREVKTTYVAPKTQIVEVDLESSLLQMSQSDYVYGNLDE